MQGLIYIFDVTTRHVAQRNFTWYFLGVLQHENKVTREKQYEILYYIDYISFQFC